MRLSQLPRAAIMRFQRPQGSDKDAGGGLLADTAAVPPLPKCPILDRLFPAHDVPQTRTGRRGGTPSGWQRAPTLLACGCDPLVRLRVVVSRAGFPGCGLQIIQG